MHATVMKTDRIQEMHQVLRSFPSHPVMCAMKYWGGEGDGGGIGICIHPLHVKAM